MDHQLGLDEPGERSRVSSLAHGSCTFVVAERPTEGDLEAIASRYLLHPLNIEDLTTPFERARIDRRDEYDFIVLHFPVLMARPDRLARAELHLVLGRQFLIVVHDGELRRIVALFEELRLSESARDTMMASPARLAYEIVSRLAASASAPIARVSEGTERIQRRLFSDEADDLIRDIVDVRREIIDLRRMVRPSARVVDEMAERGLAATPEMAAYWDDASDQMHELVDDVDRVADQLEALSVSRDQLTSTRSTRQMRVLTIMSTVMLPLAVISGVYGMNVRGLPGADTDWGLPAALIGMGSVVTAMVGILRWRRWL